jgi:VIT1/CCC1 family predicted Fe2+/Mn2+ transporter/rubrerythrin
MTSPTLQLTADERARSLANLKLERDAIALYDSLATIEKNPDRAAVFERIAKNERRHAEIWASRLEQAGATVPPISGPRPRVRLVIFLARLFGPERVADLVRGLEGDEEEAYASQMTPETEAIAADEREHAQMWDEITGTKRVATGAGRSVTEEAIHRGGRSGTLRAAVFGANDGLVSNLSLVMGVAGAVTDNHFIVLAGVAGLLAGAFSMAAGEYISMQSQREMFENQISVEREEMRIMPEVEREELAAIYRAKGVAATDAERIAGQLMEDPEKALDTMVREELGLDPDQLGSSWGAAIYSFVAFGIGAVIPLVPFLLARGDVAFISALGLSFAALFAVGAAVSIVTGKSMLFSGLRQVMIGAAAAAVTYGVGSVIGANVS